jgi:hypothetical protein
MLPTFTVAKSVASTDPQLFVFHEAGPAQESVLYADGSTITLQTETVTWPMIGSDTSKTTPEQFKASILHAREDAAASPHVLVSPTGPLAFNLQFDVTSPPPGATAALESVATYIESVFSDPITVVVNINFESMDPGILGATSSNYAGSVSYANTRSGLVNGMDSDDTLLTYLPTGTSIPVRYNINSGTATDESRCYFTIANYRATIGSINGDAADMTINSDFSWDYNPSDGISGGCYCFCSVVAHEVGHVLGFTSGADFRTNDIEALDLFRFQESNYNPGTNTQFQTTPRLVWLDESGSSYDDCVSDLIKAEYPMSDGYPYQASHFSQDSVYAIMQPAFSYGETFYPTYYLAPDKAMFDMIGWDYSGGQQGSPPNRPDQPSGETNGYQNTQYSYTSKTTDPDGDQIYYMWDWGDGTMSAWIGPKTSGQSITTAHTYQSQGSYSIRVKAKDTHNLESDWSPALPVTMPLSIPGGWQHGQLINLFLRLLQLLFPSFGGFTLS